MEISIASLNLHTHIFKRMCQKSDPACPYWADDRGGWSLKNDDLISESLSLINDAAAVKA
jgi:hypothetical protein